MVVMTDEFKVTVELVCHTSLWAMLDELHGCLALIRQPEHLAQFQNDNFFEVLVAVKILFAKPRIVAIGLVN